MASSTHEPKSSFIFRRLLFHRGPISWSVYRLRQETALVLPRLSALPDLTPRNAASDRQPHKVAYSRRSSDMTYDAMTKRAMAGTTVSFPLTGAAAAEGIFAANSNESPILASFRLWQALMNSISFDISDGDLKRVYQDMSEIVQSMLAISATNTHEFAAQFLVVCSGDVIEYRQAARQLHAHAQTLVGIA
ncbi:hypothetical protein [Mesorhizobium loti]|nr:hypothetical protein [Mesorhizobium loti]